MSSLIRALRFQDWSLVDGSHVMLSKRVCVCVWREGRFDEGDQLHYTIYIGKQTATLMQIPFCTPFVPMTLHPPAPRQERAKKDLYRF